MPEGTVARPKSVAITFGTFDIFHKGHESYLRQARKYGDYLVAVVARDVNVLALKKHAPRDSERERKKKVMGSKLADKVVLGNFKDKYQMLKKYRPNVICLGYDQRVNLVELKARLKEFGLSDTRIIRLKSFCPEVYKSSKLK